MRPLCARGMAPFARRVGRAEETCGYPKRAVSGTRASPFAVRRVDAAAAAALQLAA